MPFNDGVSRIRCFSLGDFHEFEVCPFSFFVKHHLEKKYELEKGSEFQALGNILDLSMKIFHKSKAYSQPVEYLPNIVNRAVFEIREKVAKETGKPSFYSASAAYINEDLIKKAGKIFQNYHQALKGKIKQSLGEVGFCEYLIEDGGKWKLWGGPDTYELGEDGIPEVCDYKYKENNNGWDIDLMSKIYILLASKFLLSKGYKKARFVVRLWLDPGNDQYYEEFDLGKVSEMSGFFKNKIQTILAPSEISFCEKKGCVACQSDPRTQFLKELEPLGLVV